MTNQQILEKAISQAVDGGWLPYFATFDSNMRTDNIIIRCTEGSSSVKFEYQMQAHIAGVGGYSMEFASIIFNHDFARALWGNEQEYCKACDRRHSFFSDCDAGCGNCQEAWIFHLQQMVIAKDPIKYLGENI